MDAMFLFTVRRKSHDEHRLGAGTEEGIGVKSIF
jgi:hypothetical protein